jgi:hypothetical protein
MRFHATPPLLGSHLRLDHAGYVVYVPHHLLYVSTRMDLFLSGRLWLGAAKGMSKVRRAKRFELKSGKLKMSALVKKFRGFVSTMVENAMNQRAAAILKHSHAKLQGLLPWRLH